MSLFIDDEQTVSKRWRPIRILLLLLPLLTITQPVSQIIYSSSSLIMTLILIVLTYLGHQFHVPQKNDSNLNQKYTLLQEMRKITVCLLCAYLVSVLIVEVYNIVVNVYQIGYGDEIMFWFRVVVTLANLQANLQLTDKRHRKHADD